MMDLFRSSSLIAVHGGRVREQGLSGGCRGQRHVSDGERVRGAGRHGEWPLRHRIRRLLCL